MVVATGGTVAEPEPVVQAFLDQRRFGALPSHPLEMSPRVARDLRDVADIVAAADRARDEELAKAAILRRL